jgi:ABC-type antimicrobial peptide transport system permease subunit
MSTFVAVGKFLDKADIDYELRKKIINCQSPEELLAIAQNSNHDLSILSLQELTQTIKNSEKTLQLLLTVNLSQS